MYALLSFHFPKVCGIAIFVLEMVIEVIQILSCLPISDTIISTDTLKSCAATLAQHPDKFKVTIIERMAVTGGQATSISLDKEKYGTDWMNDGVQGGSPVTFPLLPISNHILTTSTDLQAHLQLLQKVRPRAARSQTPSRIWQGSRWFLDKLLSLQPREHIFLRHQEIRQGPQDHQMDHASARSRAHQDHASSLFLLQRLWR